MDSRRAGPRRPYPPPDSPDDQRSFPKELDAALGDVLPPEKKSEVVSRVQSFLVAHAGPLPPSSELAAYEKILPGGAERIFRMAEREQEHANLVERRSLNAEIFLSILGQILGLIGLLVIVGAGAWVTWLGYVTAGVGLIAASSLAAVVPHFVRGRSVLFGFPVQPPPRGSATGRNTGPKPKRR